MLYHVYKLQMSDAARAAMNLAGKWNAHPESQVYADLRHGLRNSDTLPHSVMSAALMGMYHHGLSVEAYDIEQVFAYDNGAPCEDVTPIYHRRGLPSMSVGDVVVTKNGIFICAAMGWAALPQSSVLGFAVAVMENEIARKHPNALPSAA
jgi:hypothetical protein